MKGLTLNQHEQTRLEILNRVLQGWVHVHEGTPLLAVGGIAAAGLTVAFATGFGGIIIATIVAQLIVCVVIQWRTLRSS